MKQINVKCNIEKCEFNKHNSCTNDEIEINLMSDDYESATCSNYKESKESISTNYHIQKLNLDETGYDYIIFSRDCYSTMNYIKEILSDIDRIEEDDCSVKIIFDNLLHNGTSNDRYIEMQYNCMFKSYEGSSIRFKEVSKKHLLRKISIEYYKEQPQLIEYSILNSVQKKMLLKGMII